jgi:hypothetical protein
MVPSAPLNELDLVATSAADDAAFVALHDVATLLGRPELSRAVVIGGHMVSLHARRWGLNLFRETQDADLGVPQLALNTHEIGSAMEELGYSRVRPNRFAKAVLGGPTDREGSSGAAQAVVDILVPALTSRPRKNVDVGEVTTIEVPGLAEALNRAPVLVALELKRRNGVLLTASLKIPDEPSALILKAMAWDARRESKDAIDVWRCLEISHAASLRPEALGSHDGKRAMGILKRAFASEDAQGITALARAQRLNSTETTGRATRVRALIAGLRP